MPAVLSCAGWHEASAGAAGGGLGRELAVSASGGGAEGVGVAAVVTGSRYGAEVDEAACEGSEESAGAAAVSVLAGGPD